uniref:C3H1-type domain-containing protein n=1 Tax=Chenopodium quinoa TaxID=63459 RepID=A0A803KP62_CHEQI
MYEFKVRKCTRSRSHDWTDCPFSHPGEKARRRDPRRFHYSGTVCPEYRRSGSCSRGDECDFAHGVFECWLHPARYRTEACKDGKSCKRKVLLCTFSYFYFIRVVQLLPTNVTHESGRGTTAFSVLGPSVCMW